MSTPSQPPLVNEDEGSHRGKVEHSSRWRFLTSGPLWSPSRFDPLVLTVLAVAFLIRLVLADWNSYWLDERYSVAIYDVWNESAGEAVQALATTSVRPPLYQFTLFHWMRWFGDAEFATRALSNTYGTLAGLFLYLMLRKPFSRGFAIASLAAFSLMNMPCSLV